MPDTIKLKLEFKYADVKEWVASIGDANDATRFSVKFDFDPTTQKIVVHSVTGEAKQEGGATRGAKIHGEPEPPGMP